MTTKEDLERIILESFNKKPTSDPEVGKKYTREMAKDIAQAIDDLMDTKIQQLRDFINL